MSDTKKAFNVRLDGPLLDAIDRRAKDVGLSRNEWIERCTRWVIHTLPADVTDPVAVSAMKASAPPEVAGLRSEDMGLNAPEGKR